MTTKSFDIDFLVLISLFHNMVRCGPTRCMWKEGSQIVHFFVKTQYYSNEQLIVHGWRVDHNILVMKTKLFTISMY